MDLEGGHDVLVRLSRLDTLEELLLPYCESFYPPLLCYLYVGVLPESTLWPFDARRTTRQGLLLTLGTFRTGRGYCMTGTCNKGTRVVPFTVGDALEQPVFCTGGNPKKGNCTERDMV